MNPDELKQNYMTAPEAAIKLGVTRDRVTHLCLDGRFSGAFKAGTSWLIPREAVLNHKRMKRGPKKTKAERRVEDEALLNAALREAINVGE